MISNFEELKKQAFIHENNARRPRVVVGAEDETVLKTISEAEKEGLIDALLVGNKAEIIELALELSINLDCFEIIDTPDPDITVKTSIAQIKNGNGDILMKGKTTTGALMRQVLDGANGLENKRILSHVGVTHIPGDSRFILITDAGINIAPDLVRKRDIILNAVSVSHALGTVCPKVAVLSFIESADKPSSPSISDAVMLSSMNEQGTISDCIVEGPYALDNAVSEESVKKKGIKGRKVAGHADILLAHDIHMGNAIYKAIQVWVKVPIAAVVVGSQIPIVVPSRADSKESKLLSVALAVQLMKSTGDK